MGRSIHDVLLALGAKAGREGQNGQGSPGAQNGQFVLDLSLLDMRSVFGGDLGGDALVHVSSPEAIAFQRPPELAACGTLWLPGVETTEALAQAIVDAHDGVRTRLDDDQQTLKRLGMKPKLMAPEPRARAKASVSGRSVQVAIDGNGDLVIETVDGNRVPSESARALGTPDDSDGAEAIRRIGEIVERLEAKGMVPPSESFDVDVGDAGAWGDEDSMTQATKGAPKRSTQGLSEEQMAELADALDDDDDDALADDEVDDELIDASDEAEAMQEAEPPAIEQDEGSDPTLSIDGMSPPPKIEAGDEDDPKTVTIQARKPSSLIDALDGGGGDDEDGDEPADGASDDDAHTAAAPRVDARAAAARPPARAGDPRPADARVPPRTAVSVQVIDEPDLEDDALRTRTSIARVAPQQSEADDIDLSDDGEADADAQGDADVDVAAADEPGDGDERHARVDGDGDDARGLHAVDEDDDDEATAAHEGPGGRTAQAPDVGDDVGDGPGPGDTAAHAGAALDLDDDNEADDGSGFAERSTGAKKLLDDDEDGEAADEVDAEAEQHESIHEDDDYDEPTTSARGTGALHTETSPQVMVDPKLGATSPGFTTGPLADAAPPGSALVTAGGAARSLATREPMKVEDFPALPADSEDNDPAPTSINTPDTVQPPAPSVLSSPPTQALKPARTSDEDLEAIARGFDDGEGPRPSRGGLTVENAEPATHVPTKATVSRAPESAAPARVNQDLEDDSSDPIVQVAPVASPPVQPSYDEADIQTRAISLSEVRAALGRRTTDEEVGREDPDALEARALALEIEARVLRERAADLRSLATKPGSPKPAATAVHSNLHVDGGSDSVAATNASSLPVLPSMEVEEVSERDSQRPVATAIPRSDDDGPALPAGADARSGAGLDVDVDVDDEDEPARTPPLRAPPATAAALAAAARSTRDDDEDNPHEDADGFAPAERAPAAALTRASDEGVSMADVQAALGDIASLPGEATQVGALRDGRFSDLRQQNSQNSGDGSDVFSTGPDAPRPRLASDVPTPDPSDDDDDFEVAIGNGKLAAAALADDESNEIETEAPAEEESSGVIGLVVEDAKARDRLRKHLSPRFTQLVEASDAATAASLPELPRLDAVVLVRPRPDDATREGIEMLCVREKRPRILIISSDVRFDEMPEVSLRLPLGQRASEVAQQVLDGLKSLGVRTRDGADAD